MGQGLLPENKVCDGLAETTGEWVDCNAVVDMVPGVGEVNRLTQMGKGIANGNVSDIVEGASMTVVNAAFDVCGFFTLGLCKAPQAALKVVTVPVRAVSKKVIGEGVSRVVAKTAAEHTAESLAKQVVKSKAVEAGVLATVGTAGAVNETAQRAKRDEERARREDAELRSQAAANAQIATRMRLTSAAVAGRFDDALKEQLSKVHPQQLAQTKGVTSPVAFYTMQRPLEPSNTKHDVQLTHGASVSGDDNTLLVVSIGVVVTLLLLSEYREIWNV